MGGLISAQSKYGQYEANREGLSTAVVLLSVEASAAFAVVLLLFYTVCHTYNILPRVYASRRYSSPDQCLPYETPPDKRHPFSWLADSWSASEGDILRHYGLDVLLFLRSLKTQAIILFFCCVYGLGVILPLNARGTAARDPHLPWGSQYTTANIASQKTDVSSEEETKAFAVHVAGAYLFTLITLYVLKLHYESYVELRHQHQQQSYAPNYCILVDEIPADMRSIYAVSTYFTSLFPDARPRVTMMLDLEELDRAIQKRDKAADQLEWCRIVMKDWSQLRFRRCRGCKWVEDLHARLEAKLPTLQADVEDHRAEVMDWRSRHEQLAMQATRTAHLGFLSLEALLEDAQEQDEALRGMSTMHVSFAEAARGGGGDGDAGPAAGGGEREAHSLLSMMEADGHRGTGEGWREGGAMAGGTAVTPTSKVKKRKSAMRQLRERTRETFRFITGNPVGSTAFVSFDSLTAATIAGQCITFRRPYRMVCTPAPQPDDVIWDNICPMRRPFARFFRDMLGLGSAVLVILGFTIPVGIIAQLTNVHTLQIHVPFVRRFLERSDLARTLLPYLPAFLLILFDNVIPALFSVLSRNIWREVRTVSKAHVRVFERLYSFLLYNNLVILILSSSLNTYYALIDNPKKAAETLAALLPNISSFYITYIMIKLIIGLSMELSRFSSFFIAGFRWLFTDDLTERQRSTRILGCTPLDRPGGFYHGRVYGDNLFVWAVTMMFSLIAPIILPISFLFFFCSFIVYKRQLLFVYEPEFESAGVFWPKVYRRMVVGLFFMQAALLCVLTANLAFREIAYFTPLPLLTMVGSHWIVRNYQQAAQHLPLSVAMQIDAEAKRTRAKHTFVKDAYVQPPLKLKPAGASPAPLGGAMKHRQQQQQQHASRYERALGASPHARDSMDQPLLGAMDSEEGSSGSR